MLLLASFVLQVHLIRHVTEADVLLGYLLAALGRVRSPLGSRSGSLDVPELLKIIQSKRLEELLRLRVDAVIFKAPLEDLKHLDLLRERVVRARGFGQDAGEVLRVRCEVPAALAQALIERPSYALVDSESFGECGDLWKELGLRRRGCCCCFSICSGLEPAALAIRELLLGLRGRGRGCRLRLFSSLDPPFEPIREILLIRPGPRSLCIEATRRGRRLSRRGATDIVRGTGRVWCWPRGC